MTYALRKAEFGIENVILFDPAEPTVPIFVTGVTDLTHEFSSDANIIYADDRAHLTLYNPKVGTGTISQYQYSAPEAPFYGKAIDANNVETDTGDFKLHSVQFYRQEKLADGTSGFVQYLMPAVTNSYPTAENTGTTTDTLGDGVIWSSDFTMSTSPDYKNLAGLEYMFLRVERTTANATLFDAAMNTGILGTPEYYAGTTPPAGN